MPMLEEHRHKRPTHDFDGIVENRSNNPPVYFIVLFYGLIVWGVAFCAFYLLSGWSSQTEFQAQLQSHEAQYQGTTAEQPAKAETAARPSEPAPPQAPEPTATTAAAPAAATAKPDGKELFAQKCAMCHGADAKGGIGPDLTAPAGKFEYGKTREALFTSIAGGRGNGKMPAFEGQLKREELDALADYLLTLK